ncbi:hypothetical protein D3C74_368710 [compost metagenome]
MRMSDFLAIGWDEPYKVDFIAYCEYLLAFGLNEIESEICDLLELKRLPQLTDGEIVEGVIFKSIKDRNKKEAIEVRIRRAVGVLGIENNNGVIEPITLSTIFKVLNRYKGEVKFVVPLDKIIRIYNSANIFVHTGVIT